MGQIFHRRQSGRYQYQKIPVRRLFTTALNSIKDMKINKKTQGIANL